MGVIGFTPNEKETVCIFLVFIDLIVVNFVYRTKNVL